MEKVSIGMIGTGIYLPKGRMTAKEISEKTKGVWTEEAIIEKLGIVEKVIPSESLSDGTQEMAALASLDAIKNAQIDPKSINLILSVAEEWKEYPLTTTALYIQDRIGAINAWGIDVQNRCGTTLSALKMAKDMMNSDPELNIVLIAGGYRNGDFIDYEDKNMSMMYNLGAGGGAILLKRNHKENRLLGFHIVADGSLARTAGVEIGGQIHPITHENIDKAYQSLRLFDAKKMKDRLNEVSMDNWFHCIDQALNKSNLQREDIDFLNILHIKRSGHEAMLQALNLKEEQTIYLDHYGHIGQIDQILSLHLAIQNNRLKRGDHICMIAAGIGYVWSAGIIEWGE
jgi:3-oxoacyl-[acyl-carrier-protein] synthase III